MLERHGEVKDRRNQRIHPVYQKPELLATGPNQVWSWDITKLKAAQTWSYFHLYVIIDIFSRFVVGWMVAHRESTALAKRLMIDTLLLCHLLDWSLDDLRERKPDLYGHVVENFVATELIKLLSFSDLRAQVLHFRTSDNKEVDFVLERPDGRLAAIEVKSSDTVRYDDFKGIRALQEAACDDFTGGIVLYTGKNVVPFGEKLLAVPVNVLWQ